MATPHINAKKGDFAKTVLLPGDPLRAKFIADNFLENVRQVNSVRNMLGFTGTYKGKEISVMGTGMGVPSSSIYYTELVADYGVENLIRIGTAGGLKGTSIKDVILVLAASTDSSTNRQRFMNFDYAPHADFGLLNKAYNTASELKIPVKVGSCFTTDLFYSVDPKINDVVEKMNIMCLEMESAGLYAIANQYKVKALTIVTISDHIRTGESMSSDEREKSLGDMINIALGSV